MKILYIYYNPSHNCFYSKFGNLYGNYYDVGYVNQYGHVLVQMFFMQNGRFISFLSYEDYCIKSEEVYTSSRDKVLNLAIDFLHKLKKNK